MKNLILKSSSLLALVSKLVMAVAFLGFVSFSFTSCDTDPHGEITITDEEKPNPDPDPDPTPGDKIISVEKFACATKSIVWSKEGQIKSLTTRGAIDLDVKYRNAAVFAKVTQEYKARVEHSSDEIGTLFPIQTYTDDNIIGVYGINQKFVTGDLSIFDKEPEKSSTEATDGTVYTYKWGTFVFSLYVSSTSSVKSLTFSDVEKTDLCHNRFNTPGYIKNVVTDAKKESDGMELHPVEFFFKAELEEGTPRTAEFSFTADDIWKLKDGGNPDVPTPEPELIATKFDEERQGLEVIVPTKSYRIWAMEVGIYSDGTTKDLGLVPAVIYWDATAPETRDYNVNELTAKDLEPVKSGAFSNGNNRQGETEGVSIKGYSKTITILTDKFASQFTTNFEKPEYTNRFGKVLYYKPFEPNFTNPKTTPEDVIPGDTEDTRTFTSTVDVEYNGQTQNLEGVVILHKAHEAADKFVDWLPENVVIRDGQVFFDAVIYHTVNPTERVPKMFPIEASLTTEDRKNTDMRNYGTTTPTPELVESTNGNNEDYQWENKTYSHKFQFADFYFTATSNYRTNIKHTINGVTKMVFEGTATVEKNGQSLGTEDKGDKTKHIYDDLVNIRLVLGGTECATASQEVRYTEKIAATESKFVLEFLRVENKDAYFRLTTTWTDDNVTYSTINVGIDPSVSAEAIKPTTVRTYSIPTTPVAKQTGSTDWNEGEFSGKKYTYLSEFIYAGVTNNISSSFRTTFIYTKNGVSSNEVKINGVVEKASEVKGTEDLGNEDMYVYHDQVNYNLKVETTKVGEATQTFEYSEVIERDATYPGYHVDATYSCKSNVFNTIWQKFEATSIRYVADDASKVPAGQSSFVELTIVPTFEEVNSTNTFNKKYYEVTPTSYLGATRFNDDSGWTCGQFTSDLSSFNDKKMLEWWQRSLTAEGKDMKVSGTMGAASQVYNPIIDRGSYNEVTKVYKLDGKWYK